MSNNVPVVLSAAKDPHVSRTAKCSTRERGYPFALLRATGFCVLLALPAHAQGGFMFQGVVDLEIWKTDSASRLLARNTGHVGPIVRADFWTAIEPIRNVVLFAEFFGEAGSGRDPEVARDFLKQGGLRFSPSESFTVEAGKIRQIVGTFSARQLSFRNPLVSAPDGYATTYPVGIRVDGSVRAVDYRAGVLSLPLYRPGYTPEPSGAPRAAIGAGITPYTGFRVGVSATDGPYLSKHIASSYYQGQDWKSFRQRVFAGDAQISYGYFELNAEVAHASYEVPGKPTIYGFLYYLEPKYTFHPRFFAAMRYERNDYPSIAPQSSSTTNWRSNGVIFKDIEAGGGFRVTATSLLKVTARADRWTPNISPNAPKDNGYAIVAQWSQTVDLVDLATRRQ